MKPVPEEFVAGHHGHAPAPEGGGGLKLRRRHEGAGVAGRGAPAQDVEHLGARRAGHPEPVADDAVDGGADPEGDRGQGGRRRRRHDRGDGPAGHRRQCRGDGGPLLELLPSETVKDEENDLGRLAGRLR